jgi:hypothetical protein
LRDETVPQVPQRFNPESWWMSFLNLLTEGEDGGVERTPDDEKLDIYGMSYESLPEERHRTLTVKV